MSTLPMSVMKILRPYKQPEIAEGNEACEEETCFKRAPRIVTELHHEPVEIEGPPPPNRPKKQPLLLTIGPAFTMMIPMLLGSGMAIISTNASGGRASAFMYTGIITAVSAACIGVMWALINLRHSKKQIKEDEQLRFNTYKDYLIKIADKLRGQYKENAAILNDRYPSAEDCLEYAKNKEEDPFILILDGIEDPHNLGSIIRTAETAGVHGIIIPKRRNAAVNSTVVKVSAGATTYMKVARVNNINDTIRKLKEEGLWIIGTDGEANTYYYNQDLKGPIAIIIGSEGFGMSKLVKENSDILVKIPMQGKITSLNASVSAGIITYEAVKQRIK